MFQMKKRLLSIRRGCRYRREAFTVARHSADAPGPIAGFAMFSVMLAAAMCADLVLLVEPSPAMDSPKFPPRLLKNVFQSAEGLPQASVSAICQTRDGYLWVGTYGGLARFDGVRFLVFDPGNTSGRLGSRIRALFEDRDGVLWVGTETGLSAFREGRFAGYTVEDGLPDNVITSICQDHEGTIWVGTEGGLGRFENGRFSRFGLGSSIADSGKVLAYVGRGGGVWLTANRRLLTITAGIVADHTIPGMLPTEEVSQMCETHDGSLWIAIPNYGLRRLHKGVLTEFGVESGLLDNYVVAVTEDRDGILWIGSGGGLNCWRDNRLTSYSASGTLSDRTVRAIAEDREGNLWVGTDRGGLNRLRTGRVTSYANRDGLPGSSVVPILEDRKGNLWVGATCGGLIRYKDGVAKTYTTRDGLPSECVWALAEDRDGSIWIGTFGGGLVQFVNGRFVTFTKRDGLPHHRVFAIYQDRTGVLWVGTDGGLAQFKEGRFGTYTVADGLVNNSVRFITEDRSGALWLATAGGISQFRDGHFTNYTAKDGLSFDSVRAIMEDADGTLWIGTYGGGLNRLKNGRFTCYTTTDGLADNTVSRILADDNGNLWMIGNNGISRVSIEELNEFAAGRRETVTAIIYGVADGMTNREGSGGGQPAGWRTRDGKMWFPTITGVVMIDPNAPPEPPPPVIIEKQLVDRETIALGSKAEAGPGATDIEFDYTAPSFNNPARVLFKYRLDGYDKDWIFAGTRRTAYYTHVPPGAYRFRVIACSSDGLWNEIGASTELYLRPHLYQTIYFYVLSGVLVLLAGWAVYRWRVRHFRERAVELSRLVDQRTRAEESLRDSNRNLEEALNQLHRVQEHVIQQERLRALGQMASGVAHDFNNALTPILGYSELLLARPKMLENREQVARNLQIINTAAKDAADVVKRLREFYRHREAGELFLPVHLNELIAQAISLSQFKWKNEAQASGATITIKTEIGSLPPIPANEGELREALINLIFNAVDAMPQGGTIVFRARAEDEHVILEVSDTGTGMTNDVQQRCLEPFFTTKDGGTGLGLASAYGTIHRIGGTIEIATQLGAGTTFEIRLPIYVGSEAAGEKREGRASPQSLHVLVVDDEPQLRQLIVEYLAMDGHTAETAANGCEGLAKFNDARFDLVVSDMAMPEMSGDHMIETMKKKDPRVPVILLTGFGDIMKATDHSPEGANLVVSKPITIDGFRQAVAKVTERGR